MHGLIFNPRHNARTYVDYCCLTANWKADWKLKLSRETLYWATQQTCTNEMRVTMTLSSVTHCGVFFVVRQHVTLCDPVWQVTLGSSEVNVLRKTIPSLHLTILWRTVGLASPSCYSSNTARSNMAGDVPKLLNECLTKSYTIPPSIHSMTHHTSSVVFFIRQHVTVCDPIWQGKLRSWVSYKELYHFYYAS